ELDHCICLYLNASPTAELSPLSLHDALPILRFAPLAAEHVRQLLERQGVKDNAMLDRLGRVSGGSAGQAIALADEALWAFCRDLDRQSTRLDPTHRPNTHSAVSFTHTKTAYT